MVLLIYFIIFVLLGFCKFFIFVNMHIYVYFIFITLVTILIFVKTPISGLINMSYIVILIFLFWAFISFKLNFFHINLYIEMYYEHFLIFLLELINLIFFI